MSLSYSCSASDFTPSVAITWYPLPRPYPWECKSYQIITYRHSAIQRFYLHHHRRIDLGIWPTSHGSLLRKGRRRRNGVHNDGPHKYVFRLLTFWSQFYFLYSVTPFDVVKTRLQTQPPIPKALFPRPASTSCCQPTHITPCIRAMSSLARPLASEVVCLWNHGVMRTERVNGFMDAVRHVWRAEGINGLWKGVGTSLFVLSRSLLPRYVSSDLIRRIIGVPSSTSYILTYDYLLNDILPPFISSKPLLPLVAGILARTAISSIASPMELVRTNLQSTPISPEHPNTLRSVLTSVRGLVQARGFGCLWHGLGPTLWRDVPFSGIYWASYEAWKRQSSRYHYEGTGVALISGAISGMTAALVTSPFDVLKTRRQALIMSSSPQVVGTLSLAIQIARNEGYFAWFVGLSPRMAKIAPACGIMIACYEASFQN